MILQSKKFLLRPVQESDAASLAQNANNEKIAKNLRDGFPHPYTLKDATSFISMVLEDNNSPQTHFIIEINGKAVGMIGIHPQKDVYRKNLELGYWLGESYWNKGILTGAVKLIVDYAFANFDVHRIYAGIFETNPASMRVLEKSGFKLDAVLKETIFKNNSYYNEHIYSIKR